MFSTTIVFKHLQANLIFESTDFPILCAGLWAKRSARSLWACSSWYSVCLGTSRRRSCSETSSTLPAFCGSSPAAGRRAAAACSTILSSSDTGDTSKTLWFKLNTINCQLSKKRLDSYRWIILGTKSDSSIWFSGLIPECLSKSTTGISKIRSTL